MTAGSQTWFVGVDGAKPGWVCVVIDGAGFVTASVHAHFSEVVEAYAKARCIAVDMPLGLVDAPNREADRAARRALGRRASSIFNAPPRGALAEKSYAEASARSLEIAGKKLSKQSYFLFEKIREVDAFAADRRVFEVHPELSFQTMKAGALPHPKKTWGGLRERLRLLEGAGITLPESLGPADAVGIDDVVDAAAAAWSARRISQGEACSHPADPTQIDRSGRKIAIYA